MKYTLTLTLLFTYQLLLGQSGDYQGKIGKYPIQLELGCATYEGKIECEGRYAYTSRLQDITLSGIQEGSLIKLSSSRFEYDEGADEILELSFKEGDFSGTWKTKGKTLPVQLRALEGTDYDGLKTEALSLKRDSVTRMNGKEFVWISEKYSEKTLFRLGNGFSKTAREKLNPWLDSLQYEEAIDKLSCEDHETSYDIAYVNERLFSFSGYYSVYCGGAHPNYGRMASTLDIQTGSRLEWKQIFTSADVFQLIKEKYQGDSGLQEECEYFEYEDHWAYCTWYLSPNGVVIIPDFPHAMTPCEEEFLLSYQSLASYTKPEYKSSLGI